MPKTSLTVFTMPCKVIIGFWKYCNIILLSPPTKYITVAIILKHTKGSWSMFSLSEFSISSNCRDAICSYILDNDCSSDSPSDICSVRRACGCCCGGLSESPVPAARAVPCSPLPVHPPLVCRSGIPILSIAMGSRLFFPSFISVQGSYGWLCELGN